MNIFVLNYKFDEKQLLFKNQRQCVSSTTPHSLEKGAYGIFTFLIVEIFLHASKNFDKILIQQYLDLSCIPLLFILIRLLWCTHVFSIWIQYFPNHLCRMTSLWASINKCHRDWSLRNISCMTKMSFDIWHIGFWLCRYDNYNNMCLDFFDTSLSCKEKHNMTECMRRIWCKALDIQTELSKSHVEFW